jgi:hypothetical protein
MQLADQLRRRRQVRPTLAQVGIEEYRALQVDGFQDFG